MGRSRILRTWDACVSAKLETKLGLAFSTVAVLISALLTLALYLNVRVQLREDIRERLHDIVGMAALSIDADAHATLTRREDEDGEVYARVKRTLQRCREQTDDIHFVYTWRRSADGTLVFVVDAETDPKEVSHIGEVYDSAEPKIMAKLRTLHTVAVDESPNTDKWGTWLSGYAPFYRSDGRMEGILGMDINAADVLSHEHKFLRIAWTVFGCMVPPTL
jgi:two-component system, sensor histidine kinase and response regulator